MDHMPCMNTEENETASSNRAVQPVAVRKEAREPGGAADIASGNLPQEFGCDV